MNVKIIARNLIILLKKNGFYKFSQTSFRKLVSNEELLNFNVQIFIFLLRKLFNDLKNYICSFNLFILIWVYAYFKHDFKIKIC